MQSTTTMLIALAIGLAPTAARALPAADVFAKASPSIVVIETKAMKGKEPAQGSGVVVGPGLVVSNCHVFEDAASAVVKYRNRTYPATVRHVDRERDLCSLDAAGLVAPAATIGTSRLRVGERVYTIGAPQGLELTLAEGILSSRRGDGEYQLLQTTAAISPGSSGGGLFDDAGRLIGITTMFHKQGQQLNFSVPVEWIAELPARHEGLFRATANAKTSKADRYDSAAEAAAEAVEAQRVADEMAAEEAQRAADAAAAALEDAPAPARSRWMDDWYNFSGATTRLDTETIDISGMRVKVWTIDDYPNPTTVTGRRNVSQVLSLLDFDCAARTMRVMEATFYDAEGDSIETVRTPTSFFKVPPGTVAEGRWKDICKYRSQVSG